MTGTLGDLQRRIAAALRDPELTPPVASPRRRFDIHRNNVAAGITSVIEGRYPAIKRLVGEDFFQAMAHAYLEHSPPRSPILMQYGQGFADFIATFEPAADVPYLADVARLEWLYHEAFHAADAAPIGAAELAAVAPDQVAGLRFRLHPSLRLFASDWPAVSIWRLNVSEGEVAPTRLDKTAEHAMILRPDLDVSVQTIDAPMHTLCAALAAGSPLAEAAQAALAHPRRFDLQQALADLISMGAITGYEPSS